MIRWIVLFSLLLSATAAAADWTVSVVAPDSLEQSARRIRNVDAHPIAEALQQAGLELPARVRVMLVARDDPGASNIPIWFAGFASGVSDIVIFPDRVGSYPYDSLESVMRHELVHLALNARAGERPLPRWFHEGVAVSVESGRRLGDRFSLTVAAFTGPPLDDLTRLFASNARPDTAEAYLLATALVDDLRRVHGAELPGRVAARVAAGVPFDRAFELETGETPAVAADRAWRTYRLWTRWLPVATSPSTLWGLIVLLAFVAFLVAQSKRARRRRQWDDDAGMLDGS